MRADNAPRVFGAVCALTEMGGPRSRHGRPHHIAHRALPKRFHGVCWGRSHDERGVTVTIAKSSMGILFVFLATAVLAQDWDYQYQGQIIERDDLWDAYPTHLFIDGVHHIWFCGESTEVGPLKDAIFHSYKTGSLNSIEGWTTPVELLNHEGVPWADNHICDPSVIKGEFVFDSITYSYALYFTANLADGGGDNRGGVAFSNDGIYWTVFRDPVIHPNNEVECPGGYPECEYGAGAGTSAWGPESGKIIHLHNDSTAIQDWEWRIRYRESSDGMLFLPTLSLDTLMSEASENDVGSSPDIAFNPINHHWYGVIHNIGGGDPLKIRMLRAKTKVDLFSEWETLFGFDGTINGKDLVIVPCLARNDNTSLFVDSDGWGYMFFGTGLNRPAVDTWRIDQLRFRVSRPFVVLDTFTNIGPNRDIGDALGGTLTEVGSRPWASFMDWGLFGDGHVTPGSSLPNGSVIAMVPFPIAQESPPPSRQPFVYLNATVDPTGSGWTAIGFSNDEEGDLFNNGQVWMLLNPDPSHVEVWANGTNHLLYVGPAPRFSTAWNRIELLFDPAENTVTARLNGVPVLEGYDLDSVPFLPDIDFVGFQMVTPTAFEPRIDRFSLEWGVIYSEGFEPGSLDWWSSICPPDCPEDDLPVHSP